MASISQALKIAREHQQAGRLKLTDEICQRVLTADAATAAAWHLLGLTAYQRGDIATACQRIAQAVALEPQQARFQADLAAMRLLTGQIPAAIAAAQQAVALQSDLPDAWNTLGLALRQAGRREVAVEAFRRALAIRPDFVEAEFSLGELWAELGHVEAALACLSHVVQQASSPAEASNALGLVLKNQGRFDEAADAFRRAVQLRGDSVEALCNLASTYRHQGHLHAAAEACQQALRINPHHAGAHNVLGNVLRSGGNVAAALAHYRQSLEFAPHDAMLLSNYLTGLRYLPGVTGGELRAAAVEFDRRHAAAFREFWPHHINSPDPERPLRVGFVSPSFLAGPVGSFLIRALEHRDRGRCHVTCYHDQQRHDATTARFRAAATVWHEVFSQSDAELAALIVADGIDVLFDLTGHAARNRMLCFARKPAPIQVTWIDSVGTTGLAAMDYLLADAYHAPPGSEGDFREQVLRMPHSHVCYDPPDDPPPVGPLPAADGTSLRLGSFNHPAKLNPPTIRLWSQVLGRLPAARLVLKYQGWADAEVAQRIHRQFAEQGVDPQRLELRGWSPRRESLAAYQSIDIALDPLIHNGGLTTCDALWMGVPVVTCPGATFAARQGLSLLSNAGLQELIARDLDDYAEIVVALSRNLSRLAALRLRLREQLAASPLCDGRRFAADLWEVLRDVWRRWSARTA